MQVDGPNLSPRITKDISKPLHRVLKGAVDDWMERLDLFFLRYESLKNSAF